MVHVDGTLTTSRATHDARLTASPDLTELCSSKCDDGWLMRRGF
jgi:hypothetical protein